jgi:hypothetical protein
MRRATEKPVYVFRVDLAHAEHPVRMASTGADAERDRGGTRYAVGGGIRLTLVSTVSVTATYAVNPQRRPGEGSGAGLFVDACNCSSDGRTGHRHDRRGPAMTLCGRDAVTR